MTGRMLAFALALFSVLHVVAATLPAVVLAVVAEKGGLPTAHGLDLVAVSAALGLVHAIVVWKRLTTELRRGIAFLDAFIAEFDALVVLALLATGLLIVVLGGLAPEHSALVNQGWPVIGLWAVVLFTAIGVAELTRTAVLRWLGGAAQDRPEVS